MQNPKPSVGRIVHYVAYGTPGGEFPVGVCRAAVVSQVSTSKENPESCGVVVLNPTGLFFNPDIPHDEEKKAAGSWHWPERVAE